MANEKLPIFPYRDQIVETVNGSSVVIITAETGAGKSTQVPQFLLEDGWTMVVTEPRILAARTLSARVAEEIGTELGDVVGYRTAHERKDSLGTRCLYCTDGLALVRELIGARKQHQVLILDEVHEWNLNIEVLTAWAKLQIDSGAEFKLVVMSATLDAERLSEFFGGVPVIEVPGRLYSVEEKLPNGDMLEDVYELLRGGRNVLAFQPGKSEIAGMIRELKALGTSATILPLHGELSPEEQAQCFKSHYGSTCVVSTNVAQTSVTIDHIDAVVDSGMERRIELVDGVEGLYLKPISLSDREQRKGRAGRTKPGIYIDHCNSIEEHRPQFPVAEILRTRLDQTVLRLAVAGIDAGELSFFHQPPKEQIREARRALRVLGLMDENGVVTSLGCRVSRLPISVQFGRMIIEAEKLGVVDDVIIIAAILEQGAITARKDEHGQPAFYLWGKLCPGEHDSDILAQLAVYKAAEKMGRKEMVEKGVFAKAFYHARQKRRHLAKALEGMIEEGSSGNRELIMKAIVAGMVDHLFRRSYGFYLNGDGQQRQLDHNSVVLGAELAVGVPFDLQIKTRYGGSRTLNLLTMVTKVEPGWLSEIAPQLLKEHQEGSLWGGDTEVVTTFNGVVIGREYLPKESADELETKPLLEPEIPEEEKYQPVHTLAELLQKYTRE